MMPEIGSIRGIDQVIAVAGGPSCWCIPRCGSRTPVHAIPEDVEHAVFRCNRKHICVEARMYQAVEPETTSAPVAVLPKDNHYRAERHKAKNENAFKQVSRLCHRSQVSIGGVKQLDDRPKESPPLSHHPFTLICADAETTRPHSGHCVGVARRS